MERIKQKLLAIILIIIAGIVGYQAYVMAHGYPRAIGQGVPFWSNGSMVYCREHNNGWGYGQGAADRASYYVCVGEVSTVAKQADGLAYYVSRASARSIQDLIWSKSGSSAGQSIINMGTDFRSWFAPWGSDNFANLFSINEGNKETGNEEKNSASMEALRKDVTVKVVDELPDWFFTNVNAGSVGESDKKNNSTALSDSEINVIIKEYEKNHTKEETEAFKKELKDAQNNEKIIETTVNKVINTIKAKSIDINRFTEEQSNELKAEIQKEEGIKNSIIPSKKKEIEQQIKNKERENVNDINKVATEEVTEDILQRAVTKIELEQNEKEEEKIEKELKKIEELLEKENLQQDLRIIKEDLKTIRDNWNTTKEKYKANQISVEDYKKIEDEYYNKVLKDIQTILVNNYENTEELNQYKGNQDASEEESYNLVDLIVEQSGKISDISYDEYKYLYDMHKLFQFFGSYKNQANTFLDGNVNSESWNLLLRHLNSYSSDGTSNLLRKVDKNISMADKNSTTYVSNVTQLDQSKIVSVESKDNSYGTAVDIYAHYQLNLTSEQQAKLNSMNNENEKREYQKTIGQTLWAYQSDRKKDKDGKEITHQITIDGQQKTYYEYEKIYFEDQADSVVSFFSEELLCIGTDDQDGVIGTNASETSALLKYIECFKDDAKGTTEFCSFIKNKYPNLAKQLSEAKGSNLSERIINLYNKYTSKITNICQEDNSEHYYVYKNKVEENYWDLNWGDTKKAARLYQWLMTRDAEGVTNIDKIAGQFSIDDTDARVSIDRVSGKYLIGPYTINYSTLILNGEKLLGIDDFSVLLSMGENGKEVNKVLTQGDGKDQYNIVCMKGTTRNIKNKDGKTIEVPKSGNSFFIELDKDVKGNGKRLTENDIFKFNISYEYLKQINATVHLLRDSASDASSGTPDIWNSSHPQRLMTFTWRSERDYIDKSIATSTREYDFKLRKTDKETGKGVNGGKYIAAAKYKNSKDGSIAYFDLERQIKSYNSFEEFKAAAEAQDVSTYISESQPEGNGYILWNDIPESIAEVERTTEDGTVILSSDKIWTLECIEVEEIEAPNGYSIPTIDEIKVSNGCTINNKGSYYTVSIPTSSSGGEITWPEPSVPKDYYIPIKKVDNNGKPIDDLKLEYWFADLTVASGEWDSQNWKYGSGNRQQAITGHRIYAEKGKKPGKQLNGMAYLTNNMYSDAILLVIEEKPAEGYDYQYFQKIAMVYSAKQGAKGPEIKFLKAEDIKNTIAKQNLANWENEAEREVIQNNNWENGVLFVKDKTGSIIESSAKKVEGKEGQGIYVNAEVTLEELNNEIVEIINDEIPPYSLELFKFEDSGEYNPNLAGTRFKVWITMGNREEAAYEKEITVKEEKDENGKKIYVAKAEGIRIYGDNLALHIQEKYAKPGFESKLTVKTIALIYKAQVVFENGKVKPKLTILENTPNESLFVSNNSNLPDEFNGHPITVVNEDTISGICVGIENERAPHYLRFFKADEDGKPLAGATFTLANKDPREEGFNSSNEIGTDTSDTDGYMEFAIPSEVKGENKEYTLYLYENSSGDGHIYSDTSKNNPVIIKYQYVAGDDSITGLSIIHNGKDLTDNWTKVQNKEFTKENKKLHCQQTVQDQERTKEDGTKETVKVNVNSIKNNGYIFDFGNLKEIFLLTNNPVPYSLDWDKVEAETDIPLGNAKFEVSIVQSDGDLSNTIKEIVEDLAKDNTYILPSGVRFAKYKNDDTELPIKNLGKLINDGKQEGQDIVSNNEEGENKGRVSVDNIVTYGECYAFIKEIQTVGAHQLLNDIIVVHYKINKGETKPTILDDIYVYTPASNDKEAKVTKYLRSNGVYKDDNGKVYTNVSMDGNTLQIINQKAPYSLEINKTNALSGRPIKDVAFRAIIRHKNENGEPKVVDISRTTESGKITINDIYEYSVNDNDLITLELYETVPEYYNYFDKNKASELVYIADYIKKGANEPLQQKTGYMIINPITGEGNKIESFDKIGDTSKILFTISEVGQSNGQNDSNSSLHTVKIPNMPTYNLQAEKKEEFNGQLNNVDINGISFTGKIRKGGVNENGDVIQNGQSANAKELDVRNFTVYLKEYTSNGLKSVMVSAEGIDTHSAFFDESGNLNNNAQTFTLVLEEASNGKYAIEHPIEIEYTCQPDTDNGIWKTEYKKIKFNDKTVDIPAGQETVLIDTEELGIQVAKDGHLILINKYKFEPIQILLQKKDENGKLIDGISFEGLLEQDESKLMAGKEPRKIAFGVKPVYGKVTEIDPITTGEKIAPDGKQYNGVAVLDNIDFGGAVKLTITKEYWKDPTDKPALNFQEEPIEISGMYIAEYKKGNVTYRKLTVPNNKITVKVGNGEAKEVDITKTEALNEFVSFSSDGNVSTFYITNQYKRYNLDGNDEDKDDTPPPFSDKVIRDVQGNDTEYKNEDKKIQFTGIITDSNGEVLQNDVKVTFEKKETQNAEGKESKVSIKALDINGSISGKDENGKEKEFKLVLKENTDDEPITVIYTCTYDSSSDEFTANIIGYEYKGIRYNKDDKENNPEQKDDIVPGRVDNDGSLINYNKLYIPITKHDEKGNLVNGVVFKGTVEYPKDENGHPTKFGENGQSSWDFETVTGGKYYDFAEDEYKTAPDGVAVIVVPYEMDGDFIVTITDEYWGTKEDDTWTTTRGTMPDEQPYDLEFMEVDAAIKGYSVKKEKVDEWKTVSKLYYNGNKVEYTVENMEDEAVNVTAYNYIDVDKDGHIKFVNDEIRYNLDENTKPLFDEKIKVDSLGNAFQVKDNISFTGYIKDTDGKTLQEGQSINEEIRDKDKFTVGLDSEGRIIATDILGEISGDENTEFYFVLQELGEGEGQPLEITVIYTSVYNKQTRTFDITIKGYEYNGERYDITTETGDNTFNEIVKGYVWHKQENGEEKRDLINVLETSIPLIKYEEAKKSEGGQPILRNGIQFTGKVEAVEERVGSNGIKEYTTKKNAEGNEISQYFKIVTGEKQKDINGQNCKDPKTGLEYPSYDGVATIYGITKDYVGKVRITITEEKWKDGKELSPKENEVNFVDDIIEIIVDVKEQTEQDGTKKLVVDYGENLNWNTYSKNSTTENSSLSEELNEKIEEVIKAKGQSTTENYKVKENDEFASALLDIDTYNNDKKQDDVIGIKVVNEVKTYDIEIPKVVEVEKDGKKTYRALTPEEAAELRFTAKIYDSTYNGENTDAKPIQELDGNHVRVVVLDEKGNEIKEGTTNQENNNNKTKSVIRVSGIRGSIIGESLTLVLHEEASGGIQKIEKDIQVTYKYTNNEADKDGKPELLKFKDPNVENGNGIIDVKLIEKEDKNEEFKETNVSTNPYLVVTDEGVAIVQKEKETTLAIKKVKKVKDTNGNEVEQPVSGIKFTIRVCGSCEKECAKDPLKCTCGDDCTKCKTLTATSDEHGLAEFTGITETGEVKVVILKEEWDTTQLTEAEKEGNDKIEFINEPVVISGIKIKKGKEEENANIVDYTNAQVVESSGESKASSHVSINKNFGIQIVFKNDTATYDLEAFDSKVTNYNGTIEKVLKDVTFEAVIAKHKDGAPDITIPDGNTTFNLNDVYERSDKAEDKLQYIGPFGISSDGKIRVEGIKGTIAKQVKAEEQQTQANSTETEGTYDVILREVSSNMTPNSDESTDGEKTEEIKRPIIKIVYTSTCITDKNGNSSFKTEIKEYVWKDSEGKSHKYIPNSKVQVVDEGPATTLETNNNVANGKEIELQYSESFGEVLYVHKDGKVSLINTEKNPVAINLKKVDSNGNPVRGIKFTGKVIALLNVNDKTLIPKEELTDTENGQLMQKRIEFNFGGNDTNSGRTNYSGVALLEIPEDEIFNYEGELKVVITNEEWVDSTNKPVLGFPNEPFAITGLTLKTDPQTHKSRIEYGDIKVEKCDVNGNTQEGESAYKNKVKKYSVDDGEQQGTEILGVSVENPILDYDLDLGYKLLKSGDELIPLKEGVGFKAQVYKDGKKEATQKPNQEPDVVLNAADGKITAKAIKGDIIGNDIELILTETENGHIVKDMEITIVYSYNPDGNPNDKPTITEYKWKEKQEDGTEVDKSYKVPQDGTTGGDGEEAKNTQIGNMIYTNYKELVGIINEVIPNPLDIQIEKRDSNGATVAGIKFEGRIVAVDKNGQERKDENGKAIEKTFTTTIDKEDGTQETLNWITTDTTGIAKLHLTKEEVNKFAGNIKIEISKEDWSTDDRDPLKVDPEQRTPLDYIDGTIEITGKKINVEENSQSSIINDGEVTVTIKNNGKDVTEQYKDRVDAKAPGEISVSMKNIIKKYDLELFNKKIINVNEEEVQIKGDITFTGEIKQNDKTYPITIAFGPETNGAIIAKDIRGEIVGENITLSVKEEKTISGIIPVDIDIVYSCSYNDGKFITAISKKTIKDQNTGEILKEINGTDENGNVLEEDVVRTGVEIPIKKVDQQGKPVEGIKFTGYVISNNKNSKDEGVAFNVTTNEYGIANIALKADYSNKDNVIDEIKDKGLLGNFKVVIEKEEWAEGAEATWRAIPGNEHRKLKFVANNTEIAGFEMQEAISENIVIRTVLFDKATCNNTHVQVDKNNITINVDNPDLTYDIPFIKTDELMNEENKDKVNRLANIEFYVTIESGSDKQEFKPKTDENGMFTLENIHVFSSDTTPVTLTMKELPPADLGIQILKEPIVITYYTVVNNETGEVSFKDVKIVQNGTEQNDNNTDKIVDYIQVTLGDKEYKLINIVNHKAYSITLDKKIRVNGNEDNKVKDVIEEIGFTGCVTTNPERFGVTQSKDESGNIQYKIDKIAFEANLNPSATKDLTDTIYFSGTTANGKLEIPDITFYDRQVYVIFKEFFVNGKEPSSMECTDEVMVASFNRRISNVESTSTSSDNVTFTSIEPLNISIQVVNEAINYKVKLKKVDTDDKSRLIDYKGSQFTITLKELEDDKEVTETTDQVTLVFDEEEEIDKTLSTALPSKYIVGAQLVTETDENGNVKLDTDGTPLKYIELELNKFGNNLQLVATEDKAPAGYEAYNGDIVITYSTPEPGENKENSNITIKEIVGESVTATTSNDNNVLSLNFELPNSPKPYPLEFFKVSKETNKKLNNIQFQILFMRKIDSENWERILEDKGRLFNTVAGKITIPDIHNYGTYYMVLKETETPKNTVRLEGYHIVEVNAEIDKTPTLIYKGTFAEYGYTDKETLVDNDETIKQVLLDAKNAIENNFVEIQKNNLTEKYKAYFKNKTEANDNFYFTVENDSSIDYKINVLKKDISNHDKDLDGAMFDLYLVKANMPYTTETNLIREQDRKGETVDGKITLDLGYSEEHYSKNTYTEEQIEAIRNGTNTEALGDMLKLVLVETNPPKDYKSEFSRIEVTFYTHDGKDIKIIDIKVFDEVGNEIENKYAEYVDRNEPKEAEITLAAYNTKKIGVPLQIKKVYYKEVVVEENGQKVIKKIEQPLEGAAFSGVVYEKGKVKAGTEFSNVTTNKDGIANLGEFYVEGDIVIDITEVKVPAGFEEIDETNIECTVDGKKITDYSISTNAVEEIDWVNETNQIKIIEGVDIKYDISLQGFVWEDRPADTGTKHEDDYTVKGVATEGLYDDGVDLKIKTTDKENNPTTEISDVEDGVIVNLYNYDTGELLQQTTTYDDGLYTFKISDPFAKYYVTFEMRGKYNYDNYENVKFLVKSIETEQQNGVEENKINQYNNINDAISAAEGNLESSNWMYNSKAILDETTDKNQKLDQNTAVTTNKNTASGNRNTVRPENVQAYPIYDYFTIQNDNKLGMFVVYKQISGNNTNPDYTIANVQEDKNPNVEGYTPITFEILDPIHKYINFGIVEKTEFWLTLEKYVEEMKMTLGDDKNETPYTYEFGKYEGDKMYTLNINKADLGKLKNLDIIYRIDVLNESITDGTLKSIADYYNSDIMEYAGYAINLKADSEGKIDFDKVNWNTDKMPEDPTHKENLIPEQWSTDDVIIQRAQATTGKQIIELKPTDQYISSHEKISIYVKYNYKPDKLVDEHKNLFGKINEVNSSYVTLSVAEIYESSGEGGRKDINSENNSLENKFVNTYKRVFNDFYDYESDNQYYWDLSHKQEGEFDIYDEDAAPAMKLLIENPSTRKITGQVFDDENEDGIMNEGEVGIDGVKVSIYDEYGTKIKDTVTSTNKADGSNIANKGTYEFNGIPEGKYSLEFTYGDENTVLPKLYTESTDENGNIMKDTNGNIVIADDNTNSNWIYNGQTLPRNNNKSYNALEYQSTNAYKIEQDNDFWYRDEKRANTVYSDATDDSTKRAAADNTLNTNGKGIMNNAKAELLYSYRGSEYNKDYIETLINNAVSAKTNKFKINSMNTESTEFSYTGDTEDGSSYEDEHGNLVGTGSNAKINFGVRPREMTNLKVVKKVDNVKIYTSSGNSNVDASYNNGTVGQAGRVQWSPGNEQNGNRGYIWIQRSEEEIIGAKLEITYNITVRDESEDKIAGEEVTIVDYVQDGMNFDKNSYEDNKSWEIATASTKDNISKIGDVNINKNIDLTNVSTVVTKKVTLDENGESEDIKITLTKTLNSYSNTDIDAYTNYVEVIQTVTPGLARKDKNSIPGNFDPQRETTIEGNIGAIGNLQNVITKALISREIVLVPYDGQVPTEYENESIRLERDTAKAQETISITAETGENRATTYYILAFAVIAVFATGVGVIVTKVIKKK